MDEKLPVRASPPVVRDCAKKPCAATARERVIACLSTVIRPQCNGDIRSVDNARAEHSNIGTEYLAPIRLHPLRRHGFALGQRLNVIASELERLTDLVGIPRTLIDSSDPRERARPMI
jgi:hypothetical protein